MNPTEFIKTRKTRWLLWEWVQYHEGKGVMPNKISRGIAGKISAMTIFDPRISQIGKWKK